MVKFFSSTLNLFLEHRVAWDSLLISGVEEGAEEKKKKGYDYNREWKKDNWFTTDDLFIPQWTLWTTNRTKRHRVNVSANRDSVIHWPNRKPPPRHQQFKTNYVAIPNLFANCLECKYGTLNSSPWHARNFLFELVQSGLWEENGRGLQDTVNWFWAEGNWTVHICSTFELFQFPNDARQSIVLQGRRSGQMEICRTKIKFKDKKEKKILLLLREVLDI